MYYIVSTAKNVGEAARDLEAAVRKHAFGVLHVLDLKQTLTQKGYRSVRSAEYSRYAPRSRYDQIDHR